MTNEQMPTKIGILAGGGELPVIVARECERLGVPLIMVGFEGNTPLEVLQPFPHELSRLAAVGNTIKILKKHECTHICMAGHIKRPTLSELVPDVKGAMVMTRLFGKGRLGDDGLLRELALVLEEEGFTVVGAHEIVPALMAHHETYTRSKPSKQALADARFGADLLTHMELHDVGQAVVIQEGLVLGIEAIEGTEELIKRCGIYKRKGDKPVLIKRKKGNQDMRFDLPTIGIKTVEQLASAGFAGVFIEAGGTLIVNRDAVIAAADEHRIFITGV